MGGWSSPPSTGGGGGSIAPLVVESANVVAQRNGANAQISYVYGTYTDASNYARIKVSYSGSVGAITAESAGTGTQTELALSAAAVRVYVGSRTVAWFSPFPGGAENDRLNLSSVGSLGWAATAGADAGADTALKRISAGLIELNNGTQGTLRDLRLRNSIQNPPASVTPTNNGELVVEATSNTTLTFKLKGTDGTVRSATLTLA